MTGRKPNSGPYIVSYTGHGGKVFNMERHTWADACAVMRELLIEGYSPSVRFT